MKAAQQRPLTDDALQLERLGTEIGMLVRETAALPRRPADARGTSARPDAVFLPLCGTDIGIAVGENLAVLNFQGVQDGRAFLIPIEIETLRNLGQAVANALLLSMEKTAGRSA